MIWKKSSFSNSGGCVEVAADAEHVHVRDAKDPNGPRLLFTHSEWDAFLEGARDHQFDR